MDFFELTHRLIKPPGSTGLSADAGAAKAADVILLLPAPVAEQSGFALGLDHTCPSSSGSFSPGMVKWFHTSA